MNWFLIIWTCILVENSDGELVCAQLGKTELPVAAESVCVEMKRKFDDRWNGKNPDFYYRMKCESREEE